MPDRRALANSAIGKASRIAWSGGTGRLLMEDCVGKLILRLLRPLEQCAG